MLELSVEMFDVPAWAKDALCVEFPRMSWFAEVGESTRAAKAICARCLVRDECLSFALEEQIDAGIWGGTSERERRALRHEGVTVAAAVKSSESRAVRAQRQEAEAPQPVQLDDAAWLC